MSNRITPVSIDAARTALTYIQPNDRAVWYRIGMALKSEFGEEGFNLFQTWSEGGDSFDVKAVQSTWKSCKPGGPVTIATLIAEAKQGGFNPKDHAPAAPLSAAEAARLRHERAERDSAAAAELASNQATASLEAARTWGAAQDAGASSYLMRKGVAGHGVRYAASDVLLVPLRDGAGTLWNVQRIFAGGDKRFFTGGRVSAFFHLIGAAAVSPWLLIAEGYATAATLHEATGHAVMVAFNEANVRHVAAAARAFFPLSRVLLCADDDRETEAKLGKNPGIAAAVAAAKIVRAVWCKPDGLTRGMTDFNDLASLVGLDAVRAQIAAAVETTGAFDSPQSALMVDVGAAQDEIE